MFQLSKKVEYGLIAIRHMAGGRDGQMFTAKEIADCYNIPYELLAKILQKLVKKGFIVSYQGVNGGYSLARRPGAVTVSSVIRAIEDQDAVTIIRCETDSSQQCLIHDTCTIKNPLIKLQGNINAMFDTMTLAELL